MHHGHDMHRGKLKHFQVYTNCSNHTLQNFQHPVLTLSPDGSEFIDCCARPCRPWAGCSNEGVCSIAGS